MLNRFHVSSFLPGVVLAVGILVIAVALDRPGGFTEVANLVTAERGYPAGYFEAQSPVWPRTRADSEGYVLTVDGPATRLVSNNWSVDEFAYSIMRPEHVVGVSESAYERRISNVHRLAERYRPAVATSTEVILSLHPDLILTATRGTTDIHLVLGEAGLPLFRMFTMFTTLEEVADTIRLMGYLTGRDREAELEYESFWKAIEDASLRKPPGAPAPRIRGFGGRYSYGSETLFDDVVAAVGAVNVGAENGLRGYDPISTEMVLRWDPEWIVGGADLGQADQVRRRIQTDPAIALTTAARRDQILVFDHSVFLPMSPYTARLVEALSEALYPPRPGEPEQGVSR
jgi:iron complex transport system substrate-binding protein